MEILTLKFAPSHGRLNPHPVTIVDAQVRSFRGVNLHQWVRVPLSNRLDLVKLRVVHSPDFASCSENQRKIPCHFWGGDWAR